jgi:precorrin-2 dehydrogenase/sirohydrochlorin ferrochelatase
MVLPLVLSTSTKVGLTGQGDGLGRRAALLLASGVKPRLLPNDADEAEYAGLSLLFVAGLGSDEATPIAARARARGVLVNVEDVPDLCDFHVPASVRRGDLILTVSTGGKAPGLSRHLREWLEARFSADWQKRLDDLGEARLAWRADGLLPSEVSRRTGEFIAEQGWLS